MDLEIMAKGFLKAIKDYGDIQSEQIKLKTDLLANTFKAQQNFFWKMQEKNYQTDYQKRLQQMFEQQQGGSTNQVTQEEDVFSAPQQPQIEMGASGYQTRTPNIKDSIYKRIQLKKQKGFQLSPQETAFEQRYLGVQSKGTTIRDEILQKIVKGERLLPGEQRIYDEVIKKGNIQDMNLFPESNEDLGNETQQPEFIPQEFSEQGSEYSEINLPPEIQTTSQAVEWLTENQNMSREEAVDWLNWQNNQ